MVFRDQIFAHSWLILIVMLPNYYVVCQDGPIVKTSNGLIRGKTVIAANGNRVDSFLGVPYAEPPVGNLRFQPPVPAQPWDGIYNATSNSVACVQYIVPILRSLPIFHMWLPGGEFKEDCLKLDVWTPSPPPTNAAVMVYIYGGAFSMGATNIPAYHGDNWPAEQDVVFVAMNYRVASLGFLFLDHPETPGNVGLLDQVQALRWVKENIAAFGGDPSKITIFGQSAGGVSVGFHLLSPLSRNLFSYAILESGSPFSEWPTQSKEENVGYAMTLAEYTGCSTSKSNTTAIIDCLRTIDAMELIKNEPFRGYDTNIFRPIVDGHFLPNEPLQLLANRTFKSTPVILGVVKNEATHFLAGLLPWAFQPLSNDIKPTEEDFTEIIRLATMYKNPMLIKAIQFHYTNWRDPKNIANIIYGADKMFGDFYFTCGLEKMAKTYASAGNTVYQYYFTHSTFNSIYPKWIGTHHGHDLLYVFGDPIKKHKDYLKSEVKLSRRIMEYWANFAKTGDPNVSPSGKEMQTHWPSYTKENRKYLVLAPNSTTVGKNFREQPCAFWHELLPQLKSAIKSNRTEF